MQLGIAIQDCGVDFGSLITSSTEVRLATGLRCQITDSGPNAALAIIENHANFDGDVIAPSSFFCHLSIHCLRTSGSCRQKRLCAHFAQNRTKRTKPEETGIAASKDALSTNGFSCRRARP